MIVRWHPPVNHSSTVRDHLTRDDLIAEYMQTFYEWRARYGLADTCMTELQAAVLVDSERESITPEQRRKLRLLAQLIEDEHRRALDCAA